MNYLLAQKRREYVAFIITTLLITAIQYADKGVVAGARTAAVLGGVFLVLALGDMAAIYYCRMKYGIDKEQSR